MHQISFEYGNTLHRNAAEMLDHIVDDFLTAGGMNTYADIAESLTQFDDEKLAREIINCFGLKDLLARNDVPETALVAAVARYRTERTAIDRKLDAFLDAHFTAGDTRDRASVRSELGLDDETLISNLFENHGLDDLMEELCINDGPVIAAMARYRAAHV